MVHYASNLNPVPASNSPSSSMSHQRTPPPLLDDGRKRSPPVLPHRINNPGLPSLSHHSPFSRSSAWEGGRTLAALPQQQQQQQHELHSHPPRPYHHQSPPQHSRAQGPSGAGLTLGPSHTLDDFHPRRNRSVSEVSPSFLLQRHQEYNHQQQDHFRAQQQSRQPEERRMPLGSSASHASAGTSASERFLLGPPPSSTPTSGSSTLSLLPRFSANIRRSNTLSALHGPESSPYGGMASRKPGVQSNLPRLSSPHRIFSRQLSESGRTPSSILPPLTPSSSGTTGVLSPSSSSSAVASSTGRIPSREGSSMEADEASPRKHAKTHVASACLNCKRAHLACDVSRPCRRCVNLGKTDSCVDVRHKKRGRPRLRDREPSVHSLTSSGGGLKHGKVQDDLPHSIPAGAIPIAGGAMPPLPPPSYRSAGFVDMTAPYVAQSSSSTMPRTLHGNMDDYLADEQRQRYMSRPFAASPLAIPTAEGSSAVRGTAAGRGRSFSAVNPPSWHKHGGEHPALASGLPSPGFGPSDSPSGTSAWPVVSLILSTSLHCVRCSEECQSVLGFEPKDLMDTSFLSLVHSKDIPRIENLCASLIQPVGIRAQSLHAQRQALLTLSPAGLMMPAAGTVFLQEDNIRLRHRTGLFDTYSIRLHLGAGLGADLYRDHTLEHAYIVASVLRISSIGQGDPTTALSRSNGGGRGGGVDRDFSHPDPSILRQARWHNGVDPRHFISPSVPQTVAAPSSSRELKDGEPRRASYALVC